MTTLFHVSDVHFGGEDRAALERFAAAVADERPDGVVCTGDLTMAGRRSEYASAARWIERLKAPMVICPGNHDLPVYRPIVRMLTPYARFNALLKLVTKPIAAPGVTLVTLRTATRAQFRRDWSKGVVRPESLARAVAEVRAAPADHQVIVAVHHPLIDSPDSVTPGATRGGLAALAALAEAGADAVLSGHVHDPFDLPWRAGGSPIRLIGAGTLSVRTRGVPPSFNELTVADGRLQVVIRELG